MAGVAIRSTPGWRPLRNPLALAAPLVLFLGLFYFLPLLGVFALSLTDPELSLDNYGKLFTEPSIQRVFAVTFRICLVTTVCSVLIGYLIAYVVTHVGPRQRAWLLVLVIVPLWTSVLVRAFSWLVLLGGNGPVNQLLMASGLTDEPVRMIRSELGVYIGMVHYMIPYAVLPILTTMQGLDGRVLLAARGLGAGRAATFFRVYLPLTKPGIVSAVILVFIFSIGFYVTPAILGGGKVVMAAEYVSIQILQIVRWGTASMVAVTLVIVVLASLLLASRLVKLRQLLGGR